MCAICYDTQRSISLLQKKYSEITRLINYFQCNIILPFYVSKKHVANAILRVVGSNQASCVMLIYLFYKVIYMYMYIHFKKLCTCTYTRYIHFIKNI